jgi:hypothetical protein
MILAKNHNVLWINRKYSQSDPFYFVSKELRYDLINIADRIRRSLNFGLRKFLSNFITNNIFI